MGLHAPKSYTYVTVQIPTTAGTRPHEYNKVWICNINMAAMYGRKLDTNSCYFGLYTSAWSTLPDQLLFLLN